MSTPESRRVQTDRKSCFLDNIGVRAEVEEKRREREKNRVQEKGGREGKRGKVQKEGKKVKRKAAGVSEFSVYDSYVYTCIHVLAYIHKLLRLCV